MITLTALVYAMPVLANGQPPSVSQSEVTQRAEALAKKCGVELGITSPLDFDFEAAERALAAAQSSQFVEAPISGASAGAAAAGNSLSVTCRKKYWHLGTNTEFAVNADAQYIQNAHGRPSQFTGIGSARYAVTGGGNGLVWVEIRHVNGVRSWLSSKRKANVDARYTVRYWTFGFFHDTTTTCPGSRTL